jgi:thiol-disulfide isomerase/thioredoxin
LALSLLTAAPLVIVGGCGDQDAQAGSQAAATQDVAPAPPKSASPSDGAPTKAGAGTDYKAAPDFTLEKLGGGTVQLSSLRGKVVLVDFWATWCGPCRAVIPHLNSLQATHKKDGLEIVGVSLDRQRGEMTALEQVEAFAKTTRMDYSIAMGSQATAAAFGGVRAIPTAFLIDREGRIRNRYVGMQPANVIQKAVQSLLDEPTPESDGPI